MSTKTPTFSPDADVQNAEWTKATWDLPPYKSAEFMAAIPDLPAFRKTAAYKAAEEQGLILDDEWLAEWVSVKKPGRDRRSIHIHLD